MSKVEEKLETLKDVLDPLLTSASLQKKKFAKELFVNIITELNKHEANIQLLTAKLNGFHTSEDYLTEHNKALDILTLMGAGDIPFDFLTYKNMRWVCEHNDNQNRPFTFLELYQLERMLRIYEGIEDKLPESANELKDYFKNDRPE